MDKDQPKIRFCPFCGAEAIKMVYGVPRCKQCKAVFFANFSRYARASPKRSNVEVTGAARLHRAASSDRRERGRPPG